MDIKSILEQIGYSVTDDGDHFRSCAKYRGGDNPTSLRINKKTGKFVDFSANVSGSFRRLLELTLGKNNRADINNLLNDKLDRVEIFNNKDKLIVKKHLNLEELGTMVPNYNFYKQRGISEETQKEFDLKICMSGKMCRRVVFPIYDRNLNVIGISGRSIFPDNQIKWKHLGVKREWCYPIHISEKYIKDKKEVILVESIGDVLALYNVGIKNVISLCGLDLLKGVKAELIRLSPEKVIISTNNEPDNQNRGNDASKEIFNQLSVLFSVDKLQIKLPPKKDFGECSKEEIINWYNI